MSTNTDTNKYTILFAIAMVVIVGSLLAFTASSLKTLYSREHAYGNTAKHSVCNGNQ